MTTYPTTVYQVQGVTCVSNTVNNAKEHANLCLEEGWSDSPEEASLAVVPPQETKDEGGDD